MSRAPDLSAFPIPRKGGAKPITGDETEGATGEGGDPRSTTEFTVEGADPHPGPEPAVTVPRQLPTGTRLAPPARLSGYRSHRRKATGRRWRQP